MSEPTVETIARTGRGTGGENDPPAEPLAWSDLSTDLGSGESVVWLSLPTGHGVHTRPVFAAWTGASFVVSTNAEAVKTRHLRDAERCSLALAFDEAHVVVEADVRRLRATADLERASAAFDEVYDWPTMVQGERLDATYAAPTSGGPPFEVYELTPSTVHAFPTQDGFAPTRYRFGR